MIDINLLKSKLSTAHSLKHLSKLTNLKESELKSILSANGLEVIPKCLHCNSPLPRASSGTYKKYCNNRCAYLYKLVEKPCEACGKVFKTTKGTKYCSEGCKKEAYSTKTSLCSYCGSEFKGHKSSKYCSEKCKIQSNNLSLDNTFSICGACGSKFIGVYGCSKKCRHILSINRAKGLLSEVYGTKIDSVVLNNIIERIDEKWAENHQK